MSDIQEQPDVTKDKLPVLGILSTIFGGISMVPFAGVISPVGLILGIIGLATEPKKLMSIIGTALSALGIVTSPLLWALVMCSIDPASCDDDTDASSLSQSLEEQLEDLE